MEYTILYILYTFIAIGLIINLLLSGVRPTKTLAWFLVILVLPVLGILLYLMFGLNRRKYKFFKMKKHREVQKYLSKVQQFYHVIDEKAKTEIPEIKAHLKLAKLIIKSSNFMPLDGNKVTVLQNGEATFKSIFQALEKASKFIHLQYYIFEEGDLTERMATIFEQKIAEGVEVRLIYDGVGSQPLSGKFIQRLNDMGAQLNCFLPLRFGRVTTSLNYRNHRKIIVVDGEVGFTGGINVSDKYTKGDPVLGTWHDMHLRLEGPVVNSLEVVFSMDWYFACGKDDLLEQKYFPPPTDKGESTVQIVASGPDSKFASVRQQYFTIINQAKDYVYIANSYVIPGDAILEALQTAALSGLDVRLLIPANSDSTVVKWSIRAYFAEMMAAGIKIYLFPDGFLHSKTIVSDDEICSVGTANLDIRSFEQNFEVNAMVYDPEVARKLKKIFLDDCKKSILIDAEEFAKRPWLDRLKEGVAKIFSPIL